MPFVSEIEVVFAMRVQPRSRALTEKDGASASCFPEIGENGLCENGFVQPLHAAFVPNGSLRARRRRVADIVHPRAEPLSHRPKRIRTPTGFLLSNGFLRTPS